MLAPETFGQWLRRVRTQCNLKQAALAAETGISQSAISQLENDKFTPDDLTLKKLKQALSSGILQPTPQDLEHIDILLMQTKLIKIEGNVSSIAEKKSVGSRSTLLQLHKRLIAHYNQKITQLSKVSDQPDN